MAQFINAYDTTAMNVAVTSVVKSLDTTVSGVQSALVPYSLVMASFMLIGGKLANQLPPQKRNIAMVFQSYALYPHLTVFENIAFPLWEHTPMTDAEVQERAVEVLGFVDLGEDVLPLLPASLSGGMKKRVSLARTISLKPDVLLYDEPTTGLDPVTSMTINRLIKDLNERLSTTSVVTKRRFLPIRRRTPSTRKTSAPC